MAVRQVAPGWANCQEAVQKAKRKGHRRCLEWGPSSAWESRCAGIHRSKSAANWWMEEALEDWMERRCEAKRCVNCGKKGVIDQQDSARAVR